MRFSILLFICALTTLSVVQALPIQLVAQADTGLLDAQISIENRKGDIRSFLIRIGKRAAVAQDSTEGVQEPEDTKHDNGFLNVGISAEPGTVLDDGVLGFTISVP